MYADDGRQGGGWAGTALGTLDTAFGIIQGEETFGDRRGT